MVTIRGQISLSQHRLARRSSAIEAARVNRGRWLDENRSEVTEILPLDGFDFGDLDDLHDFGDLDDLDFSNDSTFDYEEQVLLAPELDDVDEIDNLAPLWLADAITEVLPRVTVRTDAQSRRDQLQVTDVIAVVRGGGQHRKEPTSAAKGRLLISAMAAGAAAAAAHTATTHVEAPKSETVLTANASALTGATDGTVLTPGDPIADRQRPRLNDAPTPAPSCAPVRSAPAATPPAPSPRHADVTRPGWKSSSRRTTPITTNTAAAGREPYGCRPPARAPTPITSTTTGTPRRSGPALTLRCGGGTSISRSTTTPTRACWQISIATTSARPR